MDQVVRALNVKGAGAISVVQDLLWKLMEWDAAQALLVPLQTHPQEAPAPTLIKNRERLKKANPLAPVMTLNSAKIVGLLLAQESDKRLAAVMRPCEARALAELAAQGQVSLEDLITISIDCLGSHDEGDYEQRAALWGDDVPTQESLRWSRRGQIAPYRFRRACQICEQPYYDQADITIGLLGQDVSEKILVLMKADLADRVGFSGDGWTLPATNEDLEKRRRTIDSLVAQHREARRRFLGEIRQKTVELTDLLAIFSSCTLCGDCQEACPLTAVSGFDMDAYADNTPEYIAARLLDVTRRSEACAGCGMCEAACHLGIPLMLVTQMIAEQAQLRQKLITALGGHLTQGNNSQ
jgi:formate dehydrogenase subunit beta